MIVEDVNQVVATMKVDRSTWRKVKFGDVAIKQNENVDRENTDLTRYVAGEHMGSEDLHIREWGQVSEDYLGPAFHRKFEAGDILYGSRRTYLRKVAVAHFDGITSNTTFVIKANEDTLINELLPFVMLSEGFAQHSIKNSKGSVNPYINWKDIADYEFLLPPKDQQQQIAELLWAGDEMIEQGTSLENATKKFRESTFQEFVHHTEMSSAVQVKTLLLDGPTNGYSPESNAHGNGSQTVSIGSIREGVFDPIGNIKYAEVDPLIVKRYSIEQGDVFVVRGNGNKSLCGKAGIANRSYSNMFYPDLLIRLRFDESFILPSFATYQWNHATAHSRLLRSAKSSNGIWKINGKDIRQHVLIVPSLSTQRAIVNKVEQINSNLDLIRRKLNASKALQKSLINQFF